MRNFINIVNISLLENTSDNIFDPNATYLHGGPKTLKDNKLKRYGNHNSDMGALFFVKDTINGRKYAVTYALRHLNNSNGTVYKVKINLPIDKIYNHQNIKHRNILKTTVGKQTWESYLNSSSDGQLDWTAVDDEVMNDAGFEGAIFRERLADNSEPIYSIGVFDEKYIEIIGQLTELEISNILKNQ